MKTSIQNSFLILTLMMGIFSVPLLTSSESWVKPAHAVEIGAEGEVKVSVGSEQNTEPSESEKTEDKTDDNMEHKSEIEIDVYVKGDTSLIEIEIDGKESIYTLNTTSKTEILAKIQSETSLSESEIVSIWKYNETDETNSKSKMEARVVLESEIEAKTMGIAKASIKAKERAKLLLNSIEDDVEETDKRVHAIMLKAKANGYLKTQTSSETSAKAYGLTIDGTADSKMKSNTSLEGNLFLEEMIKMSNVAKYRVSGGTLVIDDQNYDILFGKARITSSNNVESKSHMILISEVMKPNGDITTMKLLLESNSSIESSADAEWSVLSPQSKIAGSWAFNAQGQMSTVSA